MSLFNRNKKTVDFTNRMVRNQERNDNLRETINSANASQPTEKNSDENNFNFLRNMASSSQEQESEDTDERKKRLAKRLVDLTTKIEELSTQVYHLQQRVEVLERKGNKSGFEYQYKIYKLNFP